MKLSLLIAAFLHIVASENTCPAGFTLSYKGECTFMAIETYDYSKILFNTVNNICTRYGATPVLIRDQDDQDYWKSFDGKGTNAKYAPVLGIRCNTTNAIWEWSDGSPITYKPALYDPRLYETCLDTFGWWITKDGKWNTGNDTTSIYYNAWCVTKSEPLVLPDKECSDFSADSEDGVCYQIGNTEETWYEAQTICKSFGGNIAAVHNTQENSFVRRLAVSRGLINGIFLGGTLSGKSDGYGWIDGSAMDFDNFVNGFPIEGAGECVALDTNNSGGQWVNVPCDQKKAYVCAKRPTDTEPVCGESIRSEGEILYSPGFPSDSSTPCDFFLKVDAGKRLEVEILVLEANSCCDRLVLMEGSIGGDVIANLTGIVASGTKFITKTSNIMRASWQPNGGINVRGMMITFRSIAA